ncbi:MAG TPA: sulfotransferase [Woeseiaceae bacterium]|nr:sulfotransferase [Woeseiaceae bacterium]
MNLKQSARYHRRRLVRHLDLAYARLATWIPERYPDFMCIGAPRAATTWLHRELSRHPGVYLPKRKEMHFYDEPLADGLPDEDELRWRESFYFDVTRPAHLRWYWRHFREAGERLAGDITPLYSTLSAARVSMIHGQIPDLKVIYILRNPVERAWSGLRKSVWYQKGNDYLDSRSADWLLEQVMHPDVLRRGDYPRAIRNWEAVFPADRLLYLFHDDVESDAAACLAEVCRFLGLPPLRAPAAESAERVNAAPAQSMPAEIRQALNAHYAAQIRILEDRFGRSLAHWLR